MARPSLGLGSITCQRVAGDPRSEEDAYHEALDVAQEAERLGFDSIWLSEHHFLDDSYVPSLLVLAAAIAARTERITIGTDVLLAPLHHPLRLAEDAAVCDLIARGRLILGLAKGWRPEEFEGLGVALRGRHLRFEDTVTTLRQAWSGGLVTGSPQPSFPGVSVTPKPARPGGPPIWVGGTLEPAIRRAGRIGDGFMASWVTPEQLAEQAGWARDEAERASRDPEALAISTVVPIFVSEAPDPWALARDAFWHYVWKYEDMAEARGRLGPPPAPPPLGGEREEELRQLAVVGRPGEVAERLAAYLDVEPGLHLIAEAVWPALDRGVLREGMALLAERVLPLLRLA